MFRKRRFGGCRMLTGIGCVPALIGLGAGCASTTRYVSVRTTVTTILDRQQAAWNRGDIEEFMAYYWRSPDLTFSSGGEVTRGWKSTLDGYRRRYPDRKSMGRLAFTDLEVTKLGDEGALVLGRWRLERDEPVGGTFSLVFSKRDGRWVIIHDHTSREAPPQ